MKPIYRHDVIVSGYFQVFKLSLSINKLWIILALNSTSDAQLGPRSQQGRPDPGRTRGPRIFYLFAIKSIPPPQFPGIAPCIKCEFGM